MALQQRAESLGRFNWRPAMEAMDGETLGPWKLQQSMALLVVNKGLNQSLGEKSQQQFVSVSNQFPRPSTKQFTSYQGLNIMEKNNY